MHNLNTISFFNYSSPGYTGPAAKAGAGVQFFEASKAAAEQGLRVLGGYCPTVGMVGGYVQSGGHGPLAASYGLAADNTLEFEVVTVDGQHLIASPTQNSDLYWALSGGGAGDYAVVFSLTTKAHVDGPTAGAWLSFTNTNADTYWAADTLVCPIYRNGTDPVFWERRVGYDLTEDLNQPHQVVLHGRGLDQPSPERVVGCVNLW